MPHEQTLLAILAEVYECGAEVKARDVKLNQRPGFTLKVRVGVAPPVGVTAKPSAESIEGPEVTGEAKVVNTLHWAAWPASP